MEIISVILNSSFRCTKMTVTSVPHSLVPKFCIKNTPCISLIHSGISPSTGSLSCPFILHSSLHSSVLAARTEFLSKVIYISRVFYVPFKVRETEW